MRPSRRAPDELRAVTLERGVVKYAEGSCLVKFGDTHVLVIEVQGTAEKTPFSQEEFLRLMALARKGVARLVDLQKMAVT